MRQKGEFQSVSAISYRVEESFKVEIEERLSVEALAEVIMNFDSDGIEEDGPLDTTLNRGNVRFKPKKIELEM